MTLSAGTDPLTEEREPDMSRCESHPAYEADYCPLCGTTTLISERRPARQYAIGLPVVVTVADDGSVTYWIDTAEAADEIGEADQADAARVALDHVRRMEAGA